MPYITKDQAIVASRSRFANREMAAREIRKYANAPTAAKYDIFLSHAFEDAEIVVGIKAIIEDNGQSVYIDWVNDPQADRSRVTAATADMLRQRMRNCKFLLFMTTKASPSSKWMPWELGFFDGFRDNHVGILPVVDTSGGSLTGQEYLGLYPEYELTGFSSSREIRKRAASGQSISLKAAIA